MIVLTTRMTAMFRRLTLPANIDRSSVCICMLRSANYYIILDLWHSHPVEIRTFWLWLMPTPLVGRHSPHPLWNRSWQSRYQGASWQICRRILIISLICCYHIPCTFNIVVVGQLENKGLFALFWPIFIAWDNVWLFVTMWHPYNG